MLVQQEWNEFDDKAQIFLNNSDPLEFEKVLLLGVAHQGAIFEAISEQTKMMKELIETLKATQKKS